MPMTCEQFDDQLARYRDGELGPVGGWSIRAHLGRCARCAAVAAESRALDAALCEALDVGEPPQYVTQAVLLRLPAMPPARRRGLAAWNAPRWRRARLVAGAGFAALQATALWGVYRLGYTRGTRVTPAAARPVAASRRGPRAGEAVRF